MRRPPHVEFISNMADCEDEELQFITDLENSDLEMDTIRPPLIGSTIFKVDDLVDVLKRVPVSAIRDEAKLATNIL